MVAIVAHVLSTPISEILEWEIEDFIVWHDMATRIVKARML